MLKPIFYNWSFLKHTQSITLCYSLPCLFFCSQWLGCHLWKKIVNWSLDENAAYVHKSFRTNFLCLWFPASTTTTAATTTSPRRRTTPSGWPRSSSPCRSSWGWARCSSRPPTGATPSSTWTSTRPRWVQTRDGSSLDSHSKGSHSKRFFGDPTYLRV